MAIKPLWKKPDLYIVLAIILFISALVKVFEVLSEPTRAIKPNGDPVTPFFIGLIVFIFARPLITLGLKTSSMYPEWLKEEKVVNVLVVCWRVLATVFMIVGLFGILKDRGLIH